MKGLKPIMAVSGIADTLIFDERQLLGKNSLIVEQKPIGQLATGNWRLLSLFLVHHGGFIVG